MCSNLKNIFFLFFILQSYCFAKGIDDQTMGPVVPVVNHLLKQDTISKHGLSAIFKMRLLEWKDGTAITVYVLADDRPLHKVFCKKTLNVFPYQMRKTWDQLVFSGSGQAPTQLNSKAEMIRKLSSTPGAIGYLRASEITESIKVLHIESGSHY